MNTKTKDTAAAAPRASNPAAAPAAAAAVRPRHKYHGLPGRYVRDAATGELTPADDRAREAVREFEAAAAPAPATPSPAPASASVTPPAEGQ